MDKRADHMIGVSAGIEQAEIIAVILCKLPSHLLRCADGMWRQRAKKLEIRIAAVLPFDDPGKFLAVEQHLGFVYTKEVSDLLEIGARWRGGAGQVGVELLPVHPDPAADCRDRGIIPACQSQVF